MYNPQGIRLYIMHRFASHRPWAAHGSRHIHGMDLKRMGTLTMRSCQGQSKRNDEGERKAYDVRIHSLIGHLAMECQGLV